VAGMRDGGGDCQPLSAACEREGAKEMRSVRTSLAWAAPQSAVWISPPVAVANGSPRPLPNVWAIRGMNASLVLSFAHDSAVRLGM